MGIFRQLQSIIITPISLFLLIKIIWSLWVFILTSESNYDRATGNPHHFCIIYHMSEFIQIYVRGYPRRVGEQDLKKLFGRYGKVQDVRLMYDFAFVVPPPILRLYLQGLRQKQQSRVLTGRESSIAR